MSLPVNPQRILWCCEQRHIDADQLAQEVRIAPASLEDILRGEKTPSIKQLQRIADYFNKGLLFFLEQQPVQSENVYSPQFRTLTNQKPDLSPKVISLIERLEQQRVRYLGLLEELDADIQTWDPSHLHLRIADIKHTAEQVRDWLGLGEFATFESLRQAVERQGIFVFLSNGYKGQWQIPKDSLIRGFSLYYDIYPIIAIRKQETKGPQAFTLCHELAHLLLHRESIIDDEAAFETHQGKEQTANAFAGHVLVPDHFLDKIDLQGMKTVDTYRGHLKPYCDQWCVSTEVILRRLMDHGRISQQQYQDYRESQRVLSTASKGGGARYRYKEPERMFGRGFVGTVLDALENQHITPPKASMYLDNLKIADLRTLESNYAVHV